MDNPEQKRSRIPVIWDFGDLASRFATNIVVQSGEHEIFIAFFEIRPPTIFTDAEREKIESVTAQCVARIVVSADRMQGFIDAMQQNLNDYQSRRSQEEQDDGANEVE